MCLYNISLSYPETSVGGIIKRQDSPLKRPFKNQHRCADLTDFEVVRAGFPETSIQIPDLVIFFRSKTWKNNAPLHSIGLGLPANGREITWSFQLKPHDIVIMLGKLGEVVVFWELSNNKSS